MDASTLAAMDKDALKKQIENMKYQASMERWPLSKSIAAWVEIQYFYVHCWDFLEKIINAFDVSF